jgi:hypothetical protein
VKYFEREKRSFSVETTVACRFLINGPDFDNTFSLIIIMVFISLLGGLKVIACFGFGRLILRVELFL